MIWIKIKIICCGCRHLRVYVILIILWIGLIIQWLDMGLLWRIVGVISFRGPWFSWSRKLLIMFDSIRVNRSNLTNCISVGIIGIIGLIDHIIDAVFSIIDSVIILGKSPIFGSAYLKLRGWVWLIVSFISSGDIIFII